MRKIRGPISTLYPIMNFLLIAFESQPLLVVPVACMRQGVVLGDGLSSIRSSYVANNAVILRGGDKAERAPSVGLASSRSRNAKGFHGDNAPPSPPTPYSRTHSETSSAGSTNVPRYAQSTTSRRLHEARGEAEVLTISALGYAAKRPSSALSHGKVREEPMRDTQPGSQHQPQMKCESGVVESEVRMARTGDSVETSDPASVQRETSCVTRAHQLMLEAQVEDLANDNKMLLLTLASSQREIARLAAELDAAKEPVSVPPTPAVPPASQVEDAMCVPLATVQSTLSSPLPDAEDTNGNRFALSGVSNAQLVEDEDSIPPGSISVPLHPAADRRNLASGLSPPRAVDVDVLGGSIVRGLLSAFYFPLTACCGAPRRKPQSVSCSTQTREEQHGPEAGQMA